MGIRQGALSAVVFGAILLALVSVDPRVHDHFADLFSGGVSPLSARIGDLGSALWSAARDRSLDNAPLTVFAAIGAVLTLFMLRS